MRIPSCALLALLPGCVSDGSEAAERLADTAARRDSIAAVAAASMSEAHVFGLLEQIHAADSAVGSLGAQHGSTTEIKDFGRMVVREHVALRRDVTNLATNSGILPAPPSVAADAPPAALHAAVTASNVSAGWDRAYLDYAIAAHHSALENTARALAATKRADVRQFIEKSVPILQKHLDKAKSLRRTLPRDS